MPLVREKNGSISIVYNLPKELKNLITKDFAKIMIKEIENVFAYAGENIDGLIGVLCMQVGTGGIHDAFVATCDKLGLSQFKEASSLDWYDYDLFMDEILDIVGEVFFGKENYMKLCDEFMTSYTDQAEEASDESRIL